MVKTQGMGSLYKGLSAGLLRQATYTTARLGIYNNIFEAAKVYNDNKVGGWGRGFRALGAETQPSWVASAPAAAYRAGCAVCACCYQGCSHPPTNEATTCLFPDAPAPPPPPRPACSPCPCGRRLCAA
jgi:hypothetical protein